MPNRVPAPPASPIGWRNNQPYLLLSLTSLFWVGNIVFARFVGDHVPPMTLSCVGWIGAFAMLLPFAWPHLKADWPALRAKLSLLLGERPRLFHLIGFALVLAGIVIASKRSAPS